MVFENVAWTDFYVVKNPGHVCDSYGNISSPNFYISIAMIFMHILQVILINVPFFKENNVLCVAFFIVMDVVFGFVVLTVGT
jgi:hypothetical protein